jgi:CRISPR-associated protein Csm1
MMMKNIALAAMLHDAGKVIYRTGQAKNHSLLGGEFLRNPKIKIPDKNLLLEMVENHHVKQLKNSSLPDGHPAYLVYEADNIAAALDRREEEGGDTGFDMRIPLRSVFDQLQSSQEKSAYKVMGLDAKNISLYPVEAEQAKRFTNAGDYSGMVARLQQALEEVDYNGDSLNSVLKIMEAFTSYIPSSTNLKELPDISLFDHSKLTAAIACSMFQYVEDQKITDYKKHCLTHNENSRKTNQFLFISGDLSGIQDFIYTISSKGALKSLRGRSFYLEILVENLIDEILEATGLSRVNLLYSGGGHFYLLMGNTTSNWKMLEQAKNKFNEALLKMTGIQLYLELGAIPCSPDDLANDMKDVVKVKNKTGELYDRVNRQLSVGKMRRYEEEQLKALFDPDSSLNKRLRDGRECCVCKTSSVELTEWDKGGGLVCPFCEAMYACGDRLVRIEEMVFSVENFKKGMIPLPSISDQQIGLSIEGFSSWQKRHNKERAYYRVYTVNQLMTGANMATNLWVGNYNIKNADGSGLIDFKQLAQNSTGIKRLGVLRADVDNLGMTFIKGFEQTQYNTLSRFTTMSRQLSMFFKVMINDLCAGKNMTAKSFSLPGNKRIEGQRPLVIVYSGGDDVFIIGAWDAVLEMAIDLYHGFKAFTGGKLHFSAGFALMHAGYPISQMAAEAGELEDYAKSLPGKNAVALFDESQENRYSWETLIDSVIGEKLECFNSWFVWEDESADEEKIPVGMSFLYRMLELFREMAPENINLARLAYSLARREPKKEKKSYPVYQQMRQFFYQWAVSEKERNEVMMALTLYIYLKRKDEGNE